MTLLPTLAERRAAGLETAAIRAALAMPRTTAVPMKRVHRKKAK